MKSVTNEIFVSKSNIFLHCNLGTKVKAVRKDYPVYKVYSLTRSST